MNTCKTCEHWKETKPAAQGGNDYIAESVIRPYDVDLDAEMILPFVVRMCTHPAQTFGERPVEKNGFGVVDGSMYYARLITAEDFGCIRHEDKT